MWKITCRLITAIILLLGLTGVTAATYIPPDSAIGVGTYHNSSDLLINTVIPPEWTTWTDSRCVWWNGLNPYFIIDLGNQYMVQDIVVQVDNNDSYKIDYSTDNSSYSNLLTILSSYGEVGSGMDTMSTIIGNPEYIPQIDFSQVLARYLKIYATGGDNMYSISELDAYGSPIPLPGTVVLLGSGLVGLAGLRRFRKG